MKPADTLPSSITDLLKFHANRSPDRVAICDTLGRVLTFKDWHRRSALVRDVIYNIGVQSSMRVGIVFERCEWIEFAITYLGIVRAGAVAVSMLNEQERMHKQAAQALISLAIVGARIAPLEAPWIRYSDFVHRAAPVGRDADLGRNHVADVVFTSGTSGESQAIEYRHGDWIDHLSLRSLKRQPTIAHANFLPAATGGLHHILIAHLTRGLTSVAISAGVEGDPYPDEAEALVRTLRLYRPVELLMFPDFAAYLAASGTFKRADFSSVRVIATSGAPILNHVGRAIIEAVPHASLVSLYGLSEGGRATLATIWDPRRPHALGLPFGATRTRIVGNDGGEVRRGQVGELCVRVDDATGMTRRFSAMGSSPLTTDGWIPTGDLVYEDTDGVVCFVARDKDIIVVADGRRIVPSEIENRILSHPCVQEVSVVGLPLADGLEETVVAAVVSPCRDFDLADLGVVMSELPAYSRPRRMLIVDRLPKNTMGKVVRPEVQKLFSPAPL